MVTRRQVLSLGSITAASLAAGITGPVFAQGNTTSMLVGFQAGGGLDFIARALAEKLRTHVGGTVLVENKPGGAGRIAVDTLKKARPDGLTLLVTPAPVLTLLPHIGRVGYDPLKDVTPIARLATFDYGFAVSTSTNVTSLQQYIEAVKKNKELGNYGSPGSGLVPHFVGIMLARATGVDLLHVPYKGTSPAVQDLIGNHIPAVCATAPALAAAHKTGKLRVLATSGAKRNPDLPDVPTFAEAGIKDLVIDDWAGLFAPANMPKEQVEKLSKAVQAALADPSLQAAFKTQGFYAAGTSAAETMQLLKTGYEGWKPVAKASGFKETQ